MQKLKEMEPCQRCHIFSKDATLYNQIQRYIQQLPEEQCINDEAYTKRLDACDRCQSLRNGMCIHCGCFVLVRAKKRGMDCPKPGGSLWT